MTKQNTPKSWGPPKFGSSKGLGLKNNPLNNVTEFVDFYTDFDTDQYYAVKDNQRFQLLQQGGQFNPREDKKHGWEYRIFISTDQNNFDAGDVVLVQRQEFGNGVQNLKPWVNVTDKEILDKIGDMPEVKGIIKDYLTENYNHTEAKRNALIRSGNADFVDEHKEDGNGDDMDNFEIVSEPNNASATTAGEQTMPAQITPQDLTKNYNSIFKEKPLKYPIDMLVGGKDDKGNPVGSQDYIYFEQFVYKPPQAKNPLDRDSIDSAKLDTRDVNFALTNGLRSNKRIKDAQGSCMLPIPNKLGISNGVSWGEARANAVEFTAFNAASGSVQSLAKNPNPFTIFNELNNLRKQGGSILNTAFGSLAEGQSNQANVGSVVNAVVAKALLSRLNINVDVDQFITRETGSAINPNLELLFSGPQLRTFSFQFDFAPNDDDEAKMVRMIQRWFREGMLPRKNNLSTSGATLFLGSPNVFRVCYKNDKRRIKGLNTFKICALTSCEIDFTPDGIYQSYEDKNAVSQPVRSTMALTFNELTPIFRNDYSSSLNDDGNFDDPTLDDVKENITNDNAFTEDDLGF